MSLVCQIVATSVVATLAMGTLIIAAVMLEGAVGLATLGLPLFIGACSMMLDLRARWRYALLQEELDIEDRPRIRSVS